MLTNILKTTMVIKYLSFFCQFGKIAMHCSNNYFVMMQLVKGNWLLVIGGIRWSRADFSWFRLKNLSFFSINVPYVLFNQHL